MLLMPKKKVNDRSTKVASLEVSKTMSFKLEERGIASLT